MRSFEFVTEKWSEKYKRSINCSNPKGFSQKAHCAGRKKNESLDEGGWDTTLTQGTVLKPATVAKALAVIDKFVDDFNEYLKPKGLGPVKRGRPTGSGAYHEKDQEEDPDKIYGDVDLQMIAPPVEGKSYGQYSSFWNSLADEFVKSGGAPYIDNSESKPGHPIVKIGDNDYVQVDFMWHEPKMADWGATRVTPERGVKGLLSGNMYSVTGELMDMSIQHAGVQLKVIDNQRVPFSKQKGTTTVTVTTNPKSWLLDIFKYQAEQMGVEDPSIDSMLQSNPGTDINNVKISTMANGIKGLAKSFEENDMFGKGDLAKFSSADDFLQQWMDRYEEKAMLDVNAKKRDKAETPEAKARAESDRKKVLQGLEMVKGLFK